MADLVWSDPDLELLNFRISSRGAGYQFGMNIVNKFLQVNGFEKILRAHQLCNEGYQVFWGGKVNTVWSAPNYCYRCGNKASILEISDDSRSEASFRFNVFDASPESDREFVKIMKGSSFGFSSEEEGENAGQDDDLQFYDTYYNGLGELSRKAPHVEYFM
ncbi:unnamed protein product [Kuraishia capsulata CBS 1993]|uniref:Serine/threonine specific protein phosphatases domain-containing protein n=1 Tax=Kuraishia capsulata CBS 1993 TaxID=1382522 RepID=W6MLP4_9ASCO|nr:uncharacterized protein KUCA_T00003010001 [Kuraishia capsulata CBS 1993]CDK27033.1 unnamed protein product [Kuraishia capsulata CBS 1993]